MTKVRSSTKVNELKAVQLLESILLFLRSERQACINEGDEEGYIEYTSLVEDIENFLNSI